MVRSRPVDRSSRSSTLAIAGFVIAVVATALVASVPGSPLHPVFPQGVEPGGPFRWLADAFGLDELHGSALVFASVAAVVASAIAFVFVLREAWRGHLSLRTAVILAIGAHVVVATLPLLVSRDVYSYIAYGNIAGIHHANPYVQTPIDFPRDAVVSLVGPKWLSTPAVYGPLFTGFASRRGPARGLRVRAGRGVPDDGARGEPRHAGPDRHDGAPDPAVAGRVRASRRSG